MNSLNFNNFNQRGCEIKYSLENLGVKVKSCTF